MSKGSDPLVFVKTIGDAQREGANFLKDSKIVSPALDARILMAGFLKMEMTALVASSMMTLSENEYLAYLSMIRDRQTGKPVHRILGYREFFGRSFVFGDACLEPRPETELLVERVLEDYQPSAPVLFGEIGVGSGVISCTLLMELANAKAVATDIAAGALVAAQKNADILGAGERLRLYQTDCMDGLEGPFDFIVSNPPYIATSEIEKLEKDVRLFDPAAALDGGVDGLTIYRKILSQTRKLLKPDGHLYLETGHGQHQELQDMAVEMDWGIVSTHLDLSGLERIVVLKV